MRLFVAAELPADLRGALAAGAPDDTHWRPLPPESLHVTLAFLGELPDPAPVVEALGEVGGAPITAEVGEAIVLPRRRPRVHAVEVRSAGLVELQAAVASRLIAAGLYAPETRPFLPHVTVARARGRPVAASPPPAGSVPEGERFTIRSFALMRSAPNSVYTAVFRSTLLR